MATQTIPEAAFHDPVSGGDVIIGIQYDDVSLLITGVQYQNTTPKPATVTYSGHTLTLAANTQPTIQDVSAFNQHVVMETNHFGQQVPTLPGGTVTCVWPSS